MLAAAIALIALAGPFQEPPDIQSRRLSLVAQSSTNRLEDIAINRDETRILTHDRNYSPRLWDRKTMRLLRVLDAHIDKVKLVEFSPDGSRVLTVSGTEVCIWDSKTGKILQERSITEYGEVYAEATFTSDSKYVIVTTIIGQVVVYDIDLEYIELVKLFEGSVTDVQCATDAPIAAAADDLGRVVAFSIPDLKPIATFETGQHVLWSRIDRQGKNIVATTIDEKAHLFDVAGKRLKKSFDHYMGYKGGLPLTLMAALFVGKSAENLLVAEQSGLMRLYDVTTLQPVGKLEGHTAQVREIRQSVDGTKVATYGDDEQLKIWDAVGQKELPFKRGPGGPTAGEFSIDGGAFWLGFDDGSLRRHDTKTGAYDSEAIGTTAQTKDATIRGRWLYFQGDDNWIVDTLNQTSVRRLGWYMEDFRFSPRGEKASWKTIFDDEYYLLDVQSGTALMRYLNCLNAEFTRDSNYLVTSHKDGSVYAWKTTDGEMQAGWEAAKDIPIRDIAVSPTEDMVLTLTDDSSIVKLFNYLDGDTRLSFEAEYGKVLNCAFSNDGKLFAVVCDNGFGVWSATDGELVTGQKTEIEGECEVVFSPDNKWVSIKKPVGLIVVNVVAETLADIDDTVFSVVTWTPQSILVLGEKNAIYLLNPNGSVFGNAIKVVEDVSSINFNEDGSRMLTTDPCDGVVVWKVPATAEDEFVRLGSFMQMSHDTENIWLCTDRDGRYDATDPANVTGAHYVFEWTGGLETIAVEQLKDRFYEPGLLAKILGADEEQPRAVPTLDALRLYPNLTVTRARSGALRIGVEERDEGGVGVLRLWVNGKLVSTRNDPPGFFEIDASVFDRFLLPQNLLPEGQGNLVRVTVTNKSGNLESPPVTLDVGVPTDLKPPEVRLFALFVGIGDYVGTTKDLTAPANDARDLERAMKTVAERLLPGRVFSTLIATEAGKPKPTRDQIVQWFADVSTKATSSDIVVVFMAGHGVNQIAGAQDYYFLTAEADPSSVGALTATTAAISGKELATMLTGIPASKQVVILDTCHSGAFSSRAFAERSIAGDYRRAWQSIRDATGTWMLAGSASDQLSYESSNIGHGMLTYSLLEAIDSASAKGLRQSESGELYVDVERWLDYAVGRVESLKFEVGVSGVQRPQLARSGNATFPVGVMSSDQRGFIGLKAPRPILIVGQFDQDREDPLRIESLLATSLKTDESVAVWTDVSSHPRAYYLTGSYTQAGGTITVTVYLQYFGQGRDRKTLEKFTIEAKSASEAVASIAKKATELMKTTKLPDPDVIKTGGG